MAKQGMKRPEIRHRKNEVAPVPDIHGKARSGKVKANPLIADGGGKDYHGVLHTENSIPTAFPAIDNELAVENFINDFDTTAADLQDL